MCAGKTVQCRSRNVANSPHFRSSDISKWHLPAKNHKKFNIEYQQKHKKKGINPPNKPFSQRSLAPNFHRLRHRFPFLQSANFPRLFDITTKNAEISILSDALSHLAPPSLFPHKSTFPARNNHNIFQDYAAQAPKAPEFRRFARIQTRPTMITTNNDFFAREFHRKSKMASRVHSTMAAVAVARWRHRSAEIRSTRQNGGRGCERRFRRSATRKIAKKSCEI